MDSYQKEKEQRRAVKYNDQQPYRKRHRRHVGNCISPAGSRPSGEYRLTRRQSNALYNMDSVRHQIVDYHEPKRSILFRKSSIQTVIPFRKNIASCNPQPTTSKWLRTSANTNNKETIDIHVRAHYRGSLRHPDQTVRVRQPRKKEIHKIVHLPEIHCNLWLGNQSAARDGKLLAIHQITHVLNLGLEPRSHGPLAAKNVKVQTVDFNDDIHLSHHKFIASVKDGIAQLKVLLSSGFHVLVACHKGVNRSVALCIAYAVSCGQSPKTVLSYVEQEKKRVYSFWGCLVNASVRHHVAALTPSMLQS